jgi:hypothetical protein
MAYALVTYLSDTTIQFTLTLHPSIVFATTVITLAEFSVRTKWCSIRLKLESSEI